MHIVAGVSDVSFSHTQAVVTGAIVKMEPFYRIACATRTLTDVVLYVGGIFFSEST